MLKNINTYSPTDVTQMDEVAMKYCDDIPALEEEAVSKVPPMRWKLAAQKSGSFHSPETKCSAKLAMARFSHSFNIRRGSLNPDRVSIDNDAEGTPEVVSMHVKEALEEITASPFPKVSNIVEQIRQLAQGETAANNSKDEDENKVHTETQEIVARAAKMRALWKERSDAAERELRRAESRTEASSKHLRTMQDRALAARHAYNELLAHPGSRRASLLHEASSHAEQEEAALKAAQDQHEALLLEEADARRTADAARAQHQQALESEMRAKDLASALQLDAAPPDMDRQNSADSSLDAALPDVSHAGELDVRHGVHEPPSTGSSEARSEASQPPEGSCTPRDPSSGAPSLSGNSFRSRAPTQTGGSTAGSVAGADSRTGSSASWGPAFGRSCSDLLSNTGNGAGTQAAGRRRGSWMGSDFSGSFRGSLVDELLAFKEEAAADAPGNSAGAGGEEPEGATGNDASVSSPKQVGRDVKRERPAKLHIPSGSSFAEQCAATLKKASDALDGVEWSRSASSSREGTGTPLASATWKGGGEEDEDEKALREELAGLAMLSPSGRGERAREIEAKLRSREDDQERERQRKREEQSREIARAREEGIKKEMEELERRREEEEGEREELRRREEEAEAERAREEAAGAERRAEEERKREEELQRRREEEREREEAERRREEERREEERRKREEERREEERRREEEETRRREEEERSREEEGRRREEEERRREEEERRREEAVEAAAREQRVGSDAWEEAQRGREEYQRMREQRLAEEQERGALEGALRGALLEVEEELARGGARAAWERLRSARAMVGAAAVKPGEGTEGRLAGLEGRVRKRVKALEERERRAAQLEKAVGKGERRLARAVAALEREEMAAAGELLEQAWALFEEAARAGRSDKERHGEGEREGGGALGAEMGGVGALIGQWERQAEDGKGRVREARRRMEIRQTWLREGRDALECARVAVGRGKVGKARELWEEAARAFEKAGYDSKRGQQRREALKRVGEFLDQVEAEEKRKGEEEQQGQIVMLSSSGGAELDAERAQGAYTGIWDFWAAEDNVLEGMDNAFKRNNKVKAFLERVETLDL